MLTNSTSYSSTAQYFQQILNADPENIVATMQCLPADLQTCLNSHGESLLHEAVYVESPIPLLVRSLINAGADVNLLSKQKKSPIHFAIANFIRILYPANTSYKPDI